PSRRRAQNLLAAISSPPNPLPASGEGAQKTAPKRLKRSSPPPRSGGGRGRNIGVDAIDARLGNFFISALTSARARVSNRQEVQDAMKIGLLCVAVALLAAGSGCAPPDVTGDWSGSWTTNTLFNGSLTMDLTQSGNEVKGTFQVGGTFCIGS